MTSITPFASGNLTLPHPELGWVWMKWEALPVAPEGHYPDGYCARLYAACDDDTRYGVWCSVSEDLLYFWGEERTFREIAKSLFAALKEHRFGTGTAVAWFEDYHE